MLLENIDLQLQNVSNSQKALEAAAKLGCKKFVGVGSITQFTSDALVNSKERPKRPLQRVDYYGIAKSTAYKATKLKAFQLGIEYNWCILSNIYGPGDFSNNFIPATLRNILSGEELAFTSGKQTYDFMYITDAANAFVAVGESGKDGRSYFVGSGAPKSVREYTHDLLASVKDAGFNIPKYEFGAAEFEGVTIDKSLLSTTRLQKDTGFLAKTIFASGIQRTLTWFSVGPPIGHHFSGWNSQS